MKDTRELMYKQIRRHGEDLISIFKLGPVDSVKLCKSILRLENKAHNLTTKYCNGDIESDAYDVEIDKILKSLDRVLNFTGQNIPVFVNGDCRGYALKIKSQWVLEHRNSLGFSPIYQDMGGYGILAPEFTGRP